MLALHSVSGGYGSTTVLRDVTIVVPPSSVVALLGANGAGKTTLLRVASGVLPPTRGRIMLDDVDVTGNRPDQFVRMGLCHIPEGRGVFPSLSVRDNLRLAVRDGGEAEGIARATDAFPRLGQRLGQVAGTLSGGEQRMLALARAYIQRPSIVLADELSMGLAPKIVAEIFLFLIKLAREGTALLVVEQYVTRVLELADYVYTLNRGTVTFAGEPAELNSEVVFAQYAGVTKTD